MKDAPITLQHQAITSPKVSELISMFLVNKFYTKYNAKTEEMKFDLYSTIEGETIKMQFKIVKGKTLHFQDHVVKIADITMEDISPITFALDLQELFEAQVLKSKKNKVLTDRLSAVSDKDMEAFLATQAKKKK